MVRRTEAAGAAEPPARGRIWQKRMFRDATWEGQHIAGFVSGQEEGGRGATRDLIAIIKG
jgi:hypothetical protein